MTFSPKGTIEHILIERIVTCYWRLRRVYRAEESEITKQAHSFPYIRGIERVKKARDLDANSMLSDFATQVLHNSVASVDVRNKLKTLKEKVEEIGHLPKDDLLDYLALTGVIRDRGETQMMFFYNELALGKIPEEENGIEKGKKALLYVLDKDIEKTELAKEALKDVEKRDDDAEYLCRHVPEKDALEKLSRYETSIENKLYRAINQLIKMQTIRNGGKYISASSVEIEKIER